MDGNQCYFTEWGSYWAWLYCGRRLCVIGQYPPPYSVVVGNPWRIVKFVFTPEEIVEHEAKLYSEDKRIPLDVLQRNYQKWMEGHR